MFGYLRRRLLRAILLLFGVSVLSFCFFQVVPGDYFDELRLDPFVSRQTVEVLRKQHGLDAALTLRYSRWLGSLLRGDWGFSLAYNSPAGPLLRERAGNTLVLAGPSVLLAWLIAVPIGLWANTGRKWRSASTTAVVSGLLVLPDLLIILALTLLAAQSRHLPIGGMTSVDFDQMTFWRRSQDIVLHMIVPGTALVLATLPVVLSYTRIVIAEVLQSPFITAARARGIPKLRLLLGYVLPAAANPLITLLGFSIGTLLSSSVLVEAIIGWPGLGQLLLQAILQRDFDVVAGAVMLSTTLYVAANLFADLLLYAADPRIKKEG
jgi:ABC-type dipeptide/oligopeptide/nickel transport system permease component